METKEIRRNNLRDLADAHVRKGVSKADFANLIGLPASQLSQLISRSGTKNIGDTIARRVEVALSLPRGWLDVPHLDQPLIFPTEQEKDFSLRNISSTYTGHTYRIERMDVEFSCGDGRMNNEYPDIIQSIEVDAEYAKRMFGGRPASSLKITTAVGDSMRGSVEPGELVVLDVTVTRFISDGIYAFSFGDCVHIKRLQRMKDHLIVISDNQAYDRWEIGEEDEEQFHIQGFVVGKWEMNYTRLG